LMFSSDIGDIGSPLTKA